MIQRIDQKYYNYDIIGDYRIKKCRENAGRILPAVAKVS